VCGKGEVATVSGMDDYIEQFRKLVAEPHIGEWCRVTLSTWPDETSIQRFELVVTSDSADVMGWVETTLTNGFAAREKHGRIVIEATT
jgi:hypothetical protein